VIGEAAGTLQPDALAVAAQVPFAGAAVAAMAAGDVSLDRDALTFVKADHLAADVGDLADELVADGHRHRDVALRPLVPVVNMDVGAADGRAPHRDEEVVVPDLGPRHFLEPDARLALGLDERAHRHFTTPISRPTFVKAATARSMCAGS